MCQSAANHAKMADEALAPREILAPLRSAPYVATSYGIMSYVSTATKTPAAAQALLVWAIFTEGAKSLHLFDKGASHV
jgi:hypothetical protein